MTFVHDYNKKGFAQNSNICTFSSYPLFEATRDLGLYYPRFLGTLAHLPMFETIATFLPQVRHKAANFGLCVVCVVTPLTPEVDRA